MYQTRPSIEKSGSEKCLIRVGIKRRDGDAPKPALQRLQQRPEQQYLQGRWFLELVLNNQRHLGSVHTDQMQKLKMPRMWLQLRVREFSRDVSFMITRCFNPIRNSA